MSTHEARWQKPAKNPQDRWQNPGGTRGMQKASSMSALTSSIRRTPSGNMISEMASGVLKRTPSFHRQDKWDEQGGWNAKAPQGKYASHMERDHSMVSLLNLVDPKSLVDKQPLPGEIIDEEQHSALSRRGVVYVGGVSALAWYAMRLVLRDVVKLQSSVLELHAMSTIHALGWAAFLVKKIGAQESEVPQYCSRALVASLGYYLHDCWALRGTVLSNPLQLMHQASMVVSISSILRSKGVAWLALPFMGQSVPNLLQELLRVSGSIGLPVARPEVRALRLLWFLSFVSSKLALVPTWLRNHQFPEMHQPNLLYGKLSYIVCFVLDLLFMRSAVKNLPRFLNPSGPVLSVARAYKQPLQGAQAAGTAVVAAAVLGTVFGSYMTAPVALVLMMLGIRRGSSNKVRVAAGLLCSAIALDQVVPQPKEFPQSTSLFLPIFRQALNVFNYKILPGGLQYLKDLPKERHHLIATTPHGLFPWGAGTVIVSCIDAGYLPNFVGASVLGALPVAGRLLRHLGFVPATKKEILKCLQKPYPRNVTIILPGGIREMFQIREDIEISCVNLHGGFADIAKEGGCMVIPSFAFGVSQLYRVARGPLADFFAELSRKLKTSIALFTGRWGTLLPYPEEMACAMGEPIDTLLCADGKEVHQLYLERLRAAFEKHKAEFGWPDRELFFEGEKMPDPPADALDEYTALPSDKRSRL